MSSAGRNKRTHVLDTSFAALVERRLNCAVRTPKKMVSSTDMEAWRAPRKGTKSSDVLMPMAGERRGGKGKVRSDAEAHRKRTRTSYSADGTS